MLSARALLQASTSQPTARITFEDVPLRDLAPGSSAHAAKDQTPAWPTFDEAPVEQGLRDLQRAFEDQVVYVVGKEQLRIRPDTGIFRRVLLTAFLWIKENTRAKVQALNVDVDKLVEVGFVKEV